MALLEMLEKNPIFQELPIDKKHVLTTLATEFEDNDLALYLTPKELSNKLGIGSPDNWVLFLNLEPVKNYIKKATADAIQIAQRKGMLALTQQAAQGNVPAAKELNEMAGLYEKGDDNKIIVLHRVNRPKIQQTQEETK